MIASFRDRFMDAPQDIVGKTIYIGVDPSGGGSRGKYGLTAFYFTALYELVILSAVAMDAPCYPDEITKGLVDKFMKPLRKALPPQFVRCGWHLIVESNHSGTENAIVHEAFLRHAETEVTVARSDVARAREASASTIGVATTNRSKENAVTLLRKQILNGMIYFDKTFVGDKELLLDQLSRMRRVLIPNKVNKDGTPMYQINGKVKSRQIHGDKQDDVAMSLLIGLLTASRDLWNDGSENIPAKRVRLVW